MGIMAINISGSALIGVFAGLFALRWNLPEAARAFLAVGIGGDYTTFSIGAMHLVRALG
jgi:CrcB protein